jgi:hypothetical protein
MMELTKMHQTTIRFDPLVWRELEAAARRRGTSSAQYVREATMARLGEEVRRRDAWDDVLDDRSRVLTAIDVAVGHRYAAEAVCAQARLARERARVTREASSQLHASRRAARNTDQATGGDPDGAAESDSSRQRQQA